MLFQFSGSHKSDPPLALLGTPYVIRTERKGFLFFSVLCSNEEINNKQYLRENISTSIY